MFNKGDRIELVQDVTFAWGTLYEGVQGTFIEYVYGIDVDDEFHEFSQPSCVVELDPIKETCVVEEYEIRKLRG